MHPGVPAVQPASNWVIKPFWKSWINSSFYRYEENVWVKNRPTSMLNMVTLVRFVWIRQSFMQILCLENLISTPRRCPEATSQTIQLLWLPNQGTFPWSGSAISYVSQSCSCSAQQKIPALNGKSNSATREAQREQTLVSFSCLGRCFSLLPHSSWVCVWCNTNHNTNKQCCHHTANQHLRNSKMEPF